MKRILRCFLFATVILLSLSVFPSVFCAESCVLLHGKPYIDGYADFCYIQVLSTDEKCESEPLSYVGDMSVAEKYDTRLLACYDDENLYIYAEISGPCENFNNPGGKWFGNSLVLGFETNEKSIVYSIAEFYSRLQISCVFMSELGSVKADNVYSSENLPASYVKAEKDRCVYELALSWESLGVSLTGSDYVSVGAAFVFNEVPYSAENISAVQLSSGFIEGLKSGDMTGAFTSKICFVDMIQIHTHTAGEAVTVEKPTCQKQGRQIVKCTECGEVLSETVLEMSDHQSGDFVTVEEPTATEMGIKARYCVKCGCELERVYINPTGKQDVNVVTDGDSTHRHDAGKWETQIYSTCLSEGRAVKKCKICGEVLETKTLPFSEHTTGAWRVVEFPTETEDGKKARFCTVCGKELASKEIASLGAFTDFSDGNSLAEKYSEALLRINLIDESKFSEDAFSEVKAAFCEFSKAIDSGDKSAAYAAEEEYRAAYEKLMNSENISSEISPRTAETVSAGDMTEKFADDMIYRAFLITFISLPIVFAVFIAVNSVKKSKNKTEKE